MIGVGGAAPAQPAISAARPCQPRACASLHPSRDAHTGRARHWLGPVPATGVWAACQSLPPAVTVARSESPGETRTAPGTPCARATLRGERGARCGAGGRGENYAAGSGVPASCRRGLSAGLECLPCSRTHDPVRREAGRALEVDYGALRRRAELAVGGDGRPVAHEEPLGLADGVTR
jgi:hypothetical protein